MCTLSKEESQMPIPENVLVVLHENSFTVWVGERWYIFGHGWFPFKCDIEMAVDRSIKSARSKPYYAGCPV